MIHQGETRPVSPPSSPPRARIRKAPLVRTIPRPIFVGVDGSRPLEFEPSPESHQRYREHDDPEGIDRVRDHAGYVRAVDQPEGEDLDQDRGDPGSARVCVVVGPVRHRAAILMEDHPEYDDDAEDDQSAPIRFHSGTSSMGVFSRVGRMSSANSMGRASSTGFFRSP